MEYSAEYFVYKRNRRGGVYKNRIEKRNVKTFSKLWRR